jgi:hypothetical protein
VDYQRPGICTAECDKFDSKASGTRGSAYANELSLPSKLVSSSNAVRCNEKFLKINSNGNCLTSYSRSIAQASKPAVVSAKLI